MPLGNPMSHNHTTGAGLQPAAHTLRRTQRPGHTLSRLGAEGGPGRRGWGGSRWEPGRQQGARPSGSGVQGEGSCCSGRIWVTLQEELGTVTHQREGESLPGRETTPASRAAKSRMLRPSLWPPGDRRGLFCTLLEGLF